MMPRKTAHELLCDGQWDREYGSHVPLTVPWAPQVGRDLVVLWDRLTDVVYNGRKIIMELTWNVWVALVLLLGMFLAMLGYALNLKRFLPWLIIKSLRQRNQESEDIINKLSTYDEAREEVYRQALIRKNQVEDENSELRDIITQLKAKKPKPREKKMPIAAAKKVKDYAAESDIPMLVNLSWRR